MLAAAFAIGYGTAHLRPRSASAPVPESPEMVSITNLSDTSSLPRRLTVYRSVVNGRGKDVGEGPRGNADTWRIGLADGHVLFAHE